jgi:hypothetical protein
MNASSHSQRLGLAKYIHFQTYKMEEKRKGNENKRTENNMK